MTIRSAVESISADQALQYLTKYYLQTEPFTGSHFESLESYNNLETVITGSDLCAVATLNTPIPREAAMGILITEADEINDSLSRVVDRELGSLSEEEFNMHLGPDSYAQRLWDLLRRNLPGQERWDIGPTRASKIMARKRPHLIPIQDSVVKRVINQQRGDNDWRLWWEALTADDVLENRAEELRQAINRPELSTLRVLDVLLWYSGSYGKHAQ